MTVYKDLAEEAGLPQTYSAKVVCERHHAVPVTFSIDPANVLFFQFSKPVVRQISLSLLHFD